MQKGKGKVFSKRHIVTSVLVVCLAAAVWLNMKYSSFDNNVIGANKNSSDTEFIDKDSNLGQAVQTGTGVDKIATARQERNDKNSHTGCFRCGLLIYQYQNIRVVQRTALPKNKA